MGLSCCCGYEREPGMRLAYGPDDYEELSARRRQRCMSCTGLIDVGAIAARITMVRIAGNEIEERIYGEGGEIPLADKWLCERCADLYFSLDELGFCVNPHDDMRELVEEYAEMARK